MAAPMKQPEYQSLSLLVEDLADQVAKRVQENLNQIRFVEKPLYTISEAAIYLGRSESSIRHLIDDRELPVIKKGMRVHLLKKDMDIWIEKHRV